MMGDRPQTRDVAICDMGNGRYSVAVNGRVVWCGRDQRSASIVCDQILGAGATLEERKANADRALPRAIDRLGVRP